MATTLYLKQSVQSDPQDWATALGMTDDPSLGWVSNQTGDTVGWLASFIGLDTSRGLNVSTSTVNSRTGPTNPERIQTCISRPLSADVTISGTITFNIWGGEDIAGSANAGLIVRLMRFRQSDRSLSLILQSAIGSELPAGSRTLQSWSGSPTSTDMKKGDRIIAFVGIDDAGGNMGFGFQCAISFNGTTGGVDGDSYIQFTEALSFDTSTPAGDKFYFRDTASDLDLSNDERALVRGSAGASATSAVVNTQAGPTSLIQFTRTAGGTIQEWYTAPLQPFTLSSKVMVNLWGLVSLDFNGALIAEIAVCDGDGSNAVVWASDVIGEIANTNICLRTDSRLRTAILMAPDKSVTVGQRLRVRIYTEESWAQAAGGGLVPMQSGQTVTFRYDGGSAGADGDSWIQLTGSTSDYSPAALKQVYKRLIGPQHLGNTPGATLYTAPLSGAAWIRHIHVINPTGADRTVTLSIGPDSAQTRVLDARIIPASGMIEERRAAEHWLNAGEVIQANADAAAACVIVVDGIEYKL